MSTADLGARSADSLTAAASDAARMLLKKGMNAGAAIDDPLDPIYADAFVQELSAGLTDFLSGIGRDLVEGAGRYVRSTNVERDHGLFEILQNADDLDANRVVFQPVNRGRSGRWLRVAHNGGRVEAPHVLAMTLALITTKTDEDALTGKFGAGLGTLVRIADSFAVHSWPYAFKVRDQQLSLLERAAPVPGVYDPEKPDTLLFLHLRDEYPLEAFEGWFTGFDPEALLFLRSVSTLARLDNDGNPSAEHALVEHSRETVELNIDGRRVEAEDVLLSDSDNSRQWTRVSTTQPVGKGVKRTDKRTPRSTPVALAFASDRGPGRFYASLPLAIRANLPFSVNGQFDTDSSRTDLLQGEGWNEWLLDKATALAGAVARKRFETRPAEAWGVVPLQEDIGEVDEPWLKERLTGLVDAVHDELRESAALPLAGGARLEDLCFEAAELNKVLTDNDLLALTEDLHPLPRSMRDREGRWRKVLAELDVGVEVGVDAAIELLDWDDDELGLRPGRWFVELAAAALEGDHSHELWPLRCLLLENGQRLAPEQAVGKGLVLAHDDTADPLGRRLGILRPLDPAFYRHNEPTRQVADWLRHGGVRTSASPDETLHALALRDPDDPLTLTEDDLRALFEAFQAAPALADELGRRIGERVLIDGKTFVRGKPKSMAVRPAAAYLPRTSWATAAAKTEGLFWLNRYYGRALLPPGAGRARAVVREQHDGQVAQRFYRQLGVELAPRLEPRPTDIQRWYERAAAMRRHELTVTQRDALDKDSNFSGLMDDYLSPDLQAVLEDIARDRIASARKRARQVINAMSRSWRDLYAGREDAVAVWAYGEMRRQGDVPATWRALAAETPWMTNESGRRRAPRELAIRTPAFETLLHDAPHKYAFGLDAQQASLPVVRALGFEAQPTAATLIGRLEELRERELAGRRIDVADVHKCYDTLASMSPNPEARGRQRRIGDEPISAVTRRFTRGKLVRTEGAWVGPKGVFVGKPIFHHHRRFVPASAERLWRLFGMQPPDINDCIEVLREVARAGAADGELPTLIETLRHINGELEHGAKPPRTLARMPLWTTEGWRFEDHAQVYAVRDRTLQEPLGNHVPVWLPPVPIGTISALLAALGVRLLDETTFVALGINRGSRSAGSHLDTTLQLTFKHLREWLAVNDGALHDRIAETIGWERLAAAKVALNAKLQVDVPVPGYARVPLPRAAHLQLQPELVLGISDPDAMKNVDLMADLLSSVIGVEETHGHVLAHGWAKAWERASSDEELTGLRLSEEEVAAAGEQPPAPVGSSLGERQGKRPGGATQKPTQTGQEHGDEEDATTPIRRLKGLDEVDAHAELVAPGSTPAGRQAPAQDTRQRSGLKFPRRGKRVNTKTRGRSRRPRNEPDREALGLQVVAREAERVFGARYLEDVRDQDGVGADAIDDTGRYYELKSHSRGIPNQEPLEDSEFKRALTEGENYVLCIVSGLEDGQKDDVKFIVDPLRCLPWWTTSNVVIGGIREASEQGSSPEAA